MSCLRNWKLQLILFLLYIFFLFSALSCFFTCIGFQRYVCWQGGFCFCQKPLSEMSNVSSSINCTQFIKYLRGLKEPSCALNATHSEAISNTRHVCRRHSWHVFESVCSWWAHLRPPTTQERYWVENCVCGEGGGGKNPTMYKSRLQPFYFYLVRNDDETVVGIIPPSPPSASSSL